MQEDHTTTTSDNKNNGSTSTTTSRYHSTYGSTSPSPTTVKEVNTTLASPYTKGSNMTTVNQNETTTTEGTTKRLTTLQGNPTTSTTAPSHQNMTNTTTMPPAAQKPGLTFSLNDNSNASLLYVFATEFFSNGNKIHSARLLSISRNQSNFEPFIKV